MPARHNSSPDEPSQASIPALSLIVSCTGVPGCRYSGRSRMRPETSRANMKSSSTTTTIFNTILEAVSKGIEQPESNVLDRERTGRQSSPMAAIIDSHSVKATEAGGPAATVSARRSTDASAMHSFVRQNPRQTGFAAQPRRWVLDGSSPGPAAIGNWQRTLRPPSTPPVPFSTRIPSCSPVRRIAGAS